MAKEHDHGARVVKCAGCGRERWCGFGPCSKCGEFTPCPIREQVKSCPICGAVHE